MMMSTNRPVVARIGRAVRLALTVAVVVPMAQAGGTASADGKPAAARVIDFNGDGYEDYAVRALDWVSGPLNSSTDRPGPFTK
ncbi:hypothetical protein AB0B45_20015 [Nonomuraea sp. NPDC049152]|uniref:hypothetical protein n=1 Tax=Nonomuraea sp. NPDC049152 TaxID=3154350 RepID=UPI0034094494